MEQIMNKLVILSGGLDSTTLLYDVADSFTANKTLAISYKYGQKHSIELDKAKESCRKLGVKHKIIDMAFLGDIVSNVSALIEDSEISVPTIEETLGDPAPVTEVPYRNMIMCSLALAFAQANNCDEVYLGIQRHDQYGYWDTTVDFLDNMNEVSMLNRKHKIELKAPFVDLSKNDEIEIGVKLGVPFYDTWSCYEGPNDHGEACGTCPTCSERIVAFAKAGFKDPVPYAILVPWDNLIEKYYRGD